MMDGRHETRRGSAMKWTRTTNTIVTITSRTSQQRKQSTSSYSLPVAAMNAAHDHHQHDNGIIATLLSDELVAHVLEWLSFRDRRRYFSCSHSLWREREEYEALLQNLILNHLSPIHLPPIEGFTNLTLLDMREWATNAFLLCLMSEETLPNLKHLSMTKSLHVNDAGLEFLTRNSVRCQTLETVDITYCRNTTYAGTFPLRDRIVSLKLLRRQPEWMDGIYETPFENDTLHTYWADGTFQFSRSVLNSGYVCDYFLWDPSKEHHVADKLQYNDMHGLEALRAELRPFYRPGVSILRLPNEQAVLVAQTRGLYPPKAYPMLSQKDLVPLGESIYLDMNGNVAEEQAQERILLSHIPVRPLGSLMPPQAIVEKNRIHMVEQERQFRNERALRWRRYSLEEQMLHLTLGGSEQDAEAIVPYFLM